MNRFFIKNRFKQYSITNDRDKLMFIIGVLNKEMSMRYPIYNPNFVFSSKNSIKRAVLKTIDLIMQHKLNEVNVEALEIVSKLMLKIDTFEFDKNAVNKYFSLGLSV